MVTPVLTIVGMVRQSDSVWTRTPGMSVSEFSGPVGYRPIMMLGMMSLMRPLELEVLSIL